MVRVRTNMKALLKWSTYMNTLADRRLDYGDSVNGRTTSSHDNVLKVVRNLNHAAFKIQNHEKVAARMSLFNKFTKVAHGDPRLMRGALRGAAEGAEAEKRRITSQKASNNSVNHHSNHPAQVNQH